MGWQGAHVSAGVFTRALQVVPILRAGLMLLEQSATLLPVTQTYHVGYVRNEETLEVRQAGGRHGCG